MRITWDLRKAETNKWKHKVSFHDAATVFEDRYADIVYDDFGYGEDRYRLTGRAANGHRYVVVFTETTIEGGHETEIRIISAWRVRGLS